MYGRPAEFGCPLVHPFGSDGTRTYARGRESYHVHIAAFTATKEDPLQTRVPYQRCYRRSVDKSQKGLPVTDGINQQRPVFATAGKVRSVRGELRHRYRVAMTVESVHERVHGGSR